MAHWGDILQMAVLELIRKVCRAAPGEKGKYIKIILALLQSTSTAVVYEARALACACLVPHAACTRRKGASLRPVVALRFSVCFAGPCGTLLGKECCS